MSFKYDPPLMSEKDRLKYSKMRDTLKEGGNPFSHLTSTTSSREGVKVTRHTRNAIRPPLQVQLSSTVLPIRKAKVQRGKGPFCVGCGTTLTLKGPLYFGALLEGTRFFRREVEESTLLSIEVDIPIEGMEWRGRPFDVEVVGGTRSLVVKHIPYTSRKKGPVCEVCRGCRTMVTLNPGTDRESIEPLLKMESTLPLNDTLAQPSSQRSWITMDDIDRKARDLECHPRYRDPNRFLPSRPVKRGTGKTFSRLPDHPGGFRTTLFPDK